MSGGRRAALALLALASAADRSAVAAAADVNVVAGQVTDLAGKPVPGVRVQAQTWQSEPLGAGRTDAGGRFRIRCPHEWPDVTLVVDDAPGFRRYAMTGFKTGATAAITLTRVIDAAYLASLAAERDPTRFRARAADLLAPSQGTTGITFPLEVIVPALASLRVPLRAWLPADPARVATAKLPDDQDRALRMLALLGDPRDDKLIEAWMAGDAKRVARPPRTCRGPTAGAAMREWEDAHFEKEGYSKGQQRPYTMPSIIKSPDADRAVIVHWVGYENWGYTTWLVLVRGPYDWELRWVIPHEIHHTRGPH